MALAWANLTRRLALPLAGRARLSRGARSCRQLKTAMARASMLLASLPAAARATCVGCVSTKRHWRDVRGPLKSSDPNRFVSPLVKRWE